MVLIQKVPEYQNLKTDRIEKLVPNIKRASELKWITGRPNRYPRLEVREKKEGKKF